MSEPPAVPLPRPPRRRMSGPERKASIVEAAGALFAEVGYRRATMAEVARRVGVSEPVAFQNFGSKASVLSAVLHRTAGDLAEAMRRGCEEAGSVGAWLEDLVPPTSPGGTRRGAHRHLHRDLHRVLSSLGGAGSGDPGVEAELARFHRALAGALAGLLEQGRAQGSVREDLDARAGAWFLLSFLASHGLRCASGPGRAGLESAVGALVLGELLPARGLSDRGRS